MPMSHELRDHIATVVDFAERSRVEYADTREWTAREAASCMTVRVPVALLNRIRELGELVQTEPAGKTAAHA